MPLTLPWSGACRAPSWCASHEPNLLWESMSQNDVSFANTFFARLHLRALQGYAIRPYTLRQLTGNRCGRKSILTKSCAGIITFYYTTKNFIKDELNAHKMKVVTRRGTGGVLGRHYGNREGSRYGRTGYSRRYQNPSHSHAPRE